jgi:peptide/nickel transport system permease protein
MMTKQPKEQHFLKKVFAIPGQWRKRRLPPVVPLLIVIIFILCAFLATIIAPHSPVEGMILDRLLPPAGLEGYQSGHLLGTDRLGRDIFSRLIHGARISLSVSILSIMVTGAIGVLIGLQAGFFGGWVDWIIMRFVEISFSLPGVLIAVLLAAALGPSFTNVVIVMVLLLWPTYTRLVRGETMSIKYLDFVALARVAGCSDLKIMFRHILPNVMPSVLVLATLHVGLVIVLEASLSFLGIGIPPPTPSWGLMISDGRGVLERAWWITVVPGMAIVLTVISLNILGDWVRDRIDPKLRQV